MAHAPKWIKANGDEPVTEVATRSLSSRLEQVLHYLPLAAMSYEDDVEYVHQVRVWTRRADAAIEMYGELLPEWRAAWIQEQLGRIRKATNDARDDDVFARRLADDESPAAHKLSKQVHEHRVESQRAVIEVYERMSKKKGRFGRRVAALLKRVRLRGKQRRSKEPSYRTWAESHLRPILDEFFEMSDGDLDDTERLHQFRIQGKKLRYAMELLSAAFESELRKIAYPLLETLQDRLGTINDHASALDRIGRWIEANEDAERAEYFREMLNREQKNLKESRGQFSTWWNAERRDQMQDAFGEALGDIALTDTA